MNNIKTPLSDLIDLGAKTGSKEDYLRFINAFRRSMLGVVAEMKGLPQGASGTFVSSAQNPVSINGTRDDEGRYFLLAFADPPAFIQNFGQRFNAEITGESLFGAALFNPDCHGIRVNSAKSELSIMIYRSTIQQLKGGGGTEAQSSKPWWKFW